MYVLFEKQIEWKKLSAFCIELVSSISLESLNHSGYAILFLNIPSKLKLSPNILGMYDMSGNVEEWCWDSNDSGKRCVRGGSSKMVNSTMCTVYYHLYMLYTDGSNRNGFRIVRTVK